MSAVTDDSSTRFMVEDGSVVLPAPSLLISDDNPGFRETLRELFEPAGFRTLLAADGQEALEIVQAEEVHLLLLDMHMPRLTGLDVVRWVKRFKSLLPCILLTADATDELIAEATQAQAFSVIAKPFSCKQVTLTVELALHQVYNWPWTPPSPTALPGTDQGPRRSDDGTATA